jgi:hypothetical protein
MNDPARSIDPFEPEPKQDWAGSTRIDGATYYLYTKNKHDHKGQVKITNLALHPDAEQLFHKHLRSNPIFENNNSALARHAITKFLVEATDAMDDPEVKLLANRLTVQNRAERQRQEAQAIAEQVQQFSEDIGRVYAGQLDRVDVLTNIQEFRSTVARHPSQVEALARLEGML